MRPHIGLDIENDAAINEYRSAIENNHKSLVGEVPRKVRKTEVISLTKEVIDWG